MQVDLPSRADVSRAIEIWGAADARLEKLVVRYGDPAPALRHYGLVLWEGGQLQVAAQVLSGAVALAPHDQRVWNDLAGVFNAMGQRNEAAACATESLERNAGQPMIWLQLGSIRSALGDYTAGIDAFRRALALDESLVDGWVGLGVAYLASKMFQEAADALREAIARGKTDDPAVQACLGDALYSSGDFAGAVKAATVASQILPDNHALLVKRARAQFTVDAIGGSAQSAIAACEQLPITPKEVDKIVRDTFHLLSAYDDYRDAAIRLGELRLAAVPDDQTQAYLLSTLKGEPSDRAPDAYIVSFFDRFADDFDQQLIEVLDYKVPRELVELTNRANRPFTHVLDIGCGTGLAGSLLARADRSLTGVDLSPRMLEKAQQLGCYNRLVEAEVVAFLSNSTAVYDLVIAADLLIYFGDLGPLFAGTARVLKTGGLFALSIETIEEGDVLHLSSGRFAHGMDYVALQALTAGFTILTIQKTTIRLDISRPAVGALMVLAKD